MINLGLPCIRKCVHDIHSDEYMVVLYTLNSRVRKFLHCYTGHFLPEEDDKFLERVRAAVEEEERQVLAAVDTESAKDAIATAEESRISTHRDAPDSEEHQNSKENHDQLVENEGKKGLPAVADKESRKEGTKGPISNSAYDSVANLPMEFYHYYYGSNTDMGTLIEVIHIFDLALSR